jgi:hypothetical protein
MSSRNDKYPVLPFIGYGLVKDKGFFVALPFRAMSLNEYKRMHFGKVATEKAKYKAIIDVILASCLKKTYIKSFNEEGISLSKSIFIDKIELEWYLNFLHHRERDSSNYTQKVMLDAIVSTGMITDDSIRYIVSDKATVIGTTIFDMITLVMVGKVNEQMFKSTTVKIVEWADIKRFIGVEP